MTVRTSPWAPGVPCWIELATPDVRASAAFYGSVLGWTVPDGAPAGDGLVVAERRGAAAAGLRAHAEMAASWTVYLATASADVTAARVLAAGGRILAEPMSAQDGRGRTALARDPQGAVFGLWQAGTSIGSSLVNEPGGLCFEELRSPDPSGSRAFYASLFGYDFDDEPASGPEFATFRLPGDSIPLGGVRAGSGEDLAPPRWLPYFGVDDAAAACERAAAAGGTVVLAPFDMPQEEVAKIVDPQGAELWLVTSTGEAQPDRSG